MARRSSSMGHNNAQRQAPGTSKNDSNKIHHKENAMPKDAALKQEKVMITGDDILIEYVSRLISRLSRTPEDMLPKRTVGNVERFISHYVWYNADQNEQQQI